MNVNAITNFLYYEGCTVQKKNYPGLIDSVYFLFFLTSRQLDDSGSVLDVLRDVKKSGENETSLRSFLRVINPTNHDDDNMSALALYPSTELLGQGFKALRVPIDYDKSSFSCKSQGPVKGITYLSELNLVFKERSQMISELQHAIMLSGYKIGVIFRDANGDARLMVDPDYNMTAEIEDNSGQGPVGEASASIKLTQISKIPPVYWKGKLFYGDAYGMAEDLSAGHSKIDMMTGEVWHD